MVGGSAESSLISKFSFSICQRDMTSCVTYLLGLNNRFSFDFGEVQILHIIIIKFEEHLLKTAQCPGLRACPCEAGAASAPRRPSLPDGGNLPVLGGGGDGLVGMRVSVRCD